MGFKPFDRMWERIELAKENSDDDYFNKLIYMGEMTTKLVAAGMIAAIQDDRERQQYRLKHKLVRSDGIGDWSSVVDEILSGVPFQYVSSSASTEVKQLTERMTAGNWQHDCVVQLDKCLKTVVPSSEKLSTKIAVRQWFKIFAQLRNKTRGHGAVPSRKLSM